MFDEIISLIKRQLKMGATHQSLANDSFSGWHSTPDSAQPFQSHKSYQEFSAESIQLLVNTILELELKHFLRLQASKGIVNKRNGRLIKNLKCSAGTFPIVTPRDRNGDFNPTFLQKWKKQLTDETLAELAAILTHGKRPDAIAASLRVIFQNTYPNNFLHEMAAEISRILCGEKGARVFMN